MHFNRTSFSDEQLVHLYKSLLLPRLIEEKMLIHLRQGKITKWFSSYGQEAISVGATLAMKEDEYILPMHRNLGIFTSRGIPIDRLFAQFQGKQEGYTKGRDRSFHFGSKEHHLVGMISHMAAQLGVADGIALSHLLKGERKATLVITGDGGASQGDFHEALNLAAVWQLPVIFLVENNQWGLSTPSHEQFRCQSFADKGIGYGIETKQVNGNHILEVFEAVSKISEDIRQNPRPYLLECMTFRIRGHEEASGTDYYPEGLIDQWKKKDPISNYESFLLKEGVITTGQDHEIKSEINTLIETAVRLAGQYEKPESNTEREISDVYQEFFPVLSSPKGSKTNKRFVDAITDALSQSMSKHNDLIIMGQDIAEYGGVFKVTDGLVKEFGKKRVRNTPISESAVIGSSLGLSIQGVKSVIEMQFADFVSCGFNQITNNLATAHYRWGQQADVVIRLPCGGGVGAGPFHSQSPEAWFFHTAGLKIVYPSSSHDAKGLLCAAIDDPNPVLFFEHKGLYRSVSEEIPDEYYQLKMGKGKVVRKGEDLSIITYGIGVRWAKEIVGELDEMDIEIIDLMSLKPWDQELVTESVKATGKALILHEANQMGGVGAEISAWIHEQLFEHLDAPVMRLGGLDTPIPFSSHLEFDYLPKSRLKNKLEELHRY